MKAMSCHAGRHLQDPASASDFKALGVSVGLVVLNTLVDACCRAGDMKRAAALLQDMVHASTSGSFREGLWRLLSMGRPMLRDHMGH